MSGSSAGTAKVSSFLGSLVTPRAFADPASSSRLQRRAQRDACLRGVARAPRAGLDGQRRIGGRSAGGAERAEAMDGRSDRPATGHGRPRSLVWSQGNGKRSGHRSCECFLGGDGKSLVVPRQPRHSSSVRRPRLVLCAGTDGPRGAFEEREAATRWRPSARRNSTGTPASFPRQGRAAPASGSAPRRCTAATRGAS